MANLRVERGVLDTSVVIDLDVIDSNTLPLQVAVTALTMAELAAGQHAAANPAERARGQDRLQRTEAAFFPLTFDANAARAYGRIYAAVTVTGRKARGTRAIDLMTAAVAASVNLPLYMRNLQDFASLDGLVEIIVI